jgi:hypothetical protein
VGNSFYNDNQQYTELAEQGTLLAEVQALEASAQEAADAAQAAAATAQGYLSTQVISGAGLTGGGDLTASRTLAVGAGTGITVNADDVALDTANTRNVDHATVSVTAGTGLTGGGTIAATRTVSLDGASTLNTDHATVSVTAGTGLTGGGTIAATRTISLAPVADKSILANVSGSSAAPSAQSLSAILDAAIGTTRGMIAVRGASSWQALAVGASGRFLKSDGTDPSWAVIPAGGDLVSTNNLSDVANTTTARQNIHAVLKGHIDGLKLSNNVSDATNDIDIASGEAADDAGSFLIRLSSGLTKRLDAAWSVGTGNGGLDTGSIANTTYHLFLIQRSDTGVSDVLFSTSPTSPTMPTNYDRKRRIGSIIRSGAAILGFTQFGNEFTLNTEALDNNGAVAPASTNGILQTLTVPSGIQVIAQVVAGALWTSAGNYLKVTSPDQTDIAASATNYTIFVTSGVTTSWIGLLVRSNTSSQIRYRVDSTTMQVRVLTRGWIDPL